MARVRDLVLRDGRRIDGARVDVRTSRSGGPGGQHVNKTETRVEVRLALVDVPGTVDDLERLRTALAARLDKDGRVFVVRDTSRSQLDNLEDALAALEALLSQALVRPKRRKATRPGRGATERRLQGKRSQAEKKRTRGARDFD